MILSYPRRLGLVDLARAGAGLLVTVGPLVAVPLAWPALVALGAGAVVFTIFAAQALYVQRVRIALDDEGLDVWPGGWRLDWRELGSLSLAYYSLRRDAERGWFELVLGVRGRRLRLDSRLAGFDALIRAAIRGAEDHGIELDVTTRENAAALLAGREGGGAGE